MREQATHATVESVVRRDYGRLIAYLAARSGDVAGAEDALGEAFASAMKRWPVDGIPEKPEAWLLHVARNKMIDAVRHRQVRDQAVERLMISDGLDSQEASEPEAIPDDRLKLLFVCAHPAIDPAARTPLMLQTVLGVDAARIASAFLVSPAAMSQRLVRVKNKIREAAIPFRVPEAAEWNERLSFVLDAIYAAYTTGWESVGEVGTTHHALAGEAISLGRTLLSLMPGEPEAMGLLSLMLHCEARRDARLSDEGTFIPLDQQDPALWSRSMIAEAEDYLRTASVDENIGRYQLEAAIQSIHANRAHTGVIDWKVILLLYEGLVQLSPGVGPLVGRAVAMAESGHAEDALESLGQLPPARIASYQPYWAARGHLLVLLDRKDEANDALTRAACLTDDPALRAHLLKRVAALA